VIKRSIDVLKRMARRGLGVSNLRLIYNTAKDALEELLLTLDRILTDLLKIMRQKDLKHLFVIIFPESGIEEVSVLFMCVHTSHHMILLCVI
jgi:hypothetical protein